MKQIIKDNFIILTGAMGAGKSTVLNRLKGLGYACMDEPARIVLAEQRAKRGNGLPETDADLFTQLMLDKMKREYLARMKDTSPVLFDRAFADLIGYANLFNTDDTPYKNASMQYRFNRYVFMFNGWKEIYTTDDERKMSYVQADKFGKSLRKIYNNCGYFICDVPFTDVNARAEFIIDKLKVIV